MADRVTLKLVGPASYTGYGIVVTYNGTVTITDNDSLVGVLLGRGFRETNRETLDMDSIFPISPVVRLPLPPTQPVGTINATMIGKAGLISKK